MKGNRNDLVNISVVGPFTAPSATCLLESDVDQGRYAQIITATGGVKSSICTTDWARDLDVIGSSVLGLKASFPLKATPDPAHGITVTVDGVTRSTGWAFEARTHAIVFATPPAPGAIITATYRTLCL